MDSSSGMHMFSTVGVQGQMVYGGKEKVKEAAHVRLSHRSASADTTIYAVLFIYFTLFQPFRGLLWETCSGLSFS